MVAALVVQGDAFASVRCLSAAAASVILSLQTRAQRIAIPTADAVRD